MFLLVEGVSVSDELIEFVGPEPIDFGLKLSESGRHNSVDPLPSGFLGLDEADVRKEQQMLRDRRSGDVELAGDVRHRPGLLSQQLEDAAPSGLGGSGESVDHG